MLRSVLQGLMLEDKSTQVIWLVTTPCTIGVAMLFQSPSRGLAGMSGPGSHLQPMLKDLALKNKLMRILLLPMPLIW